MIGRAGREYAYLMTSTVLAVPAFALALLGVVFSALTVVGVGLPFLVCILWTVRHTSRWFRHPARKLPGAVLGTYVLLAGPVFATYPAWWWIHPGAVGPFDARTWAGTWWLGTQGAIAVLLLPCFLRLLVTIDRLLAYALLAPSRAELRIRALEAGRLALQADAAALLRRVERDLHDGTQARLVALGMTLSRIERHVSADEGRQLIGGARAAITEALTELRDIIRGMHPPALNDGLEAAADRPRRWSGRCPCGRCGHRLEWAGSPGCGAGRGVQRPEPDRRAHLDHHHPAPALTVWRRARCAPSSPRTIR
ncbi:MAG TPA: histidine kinase [Micromonosporaceae bacterium]|nr:histidine kinase [Micromonosporaceae bacterium]